MAKDKLEFMVNPFTVSRVFTFLYGKKINRKAMINSIRANLVFTSPYADFCLI